MRIERADWDGASAADRARSMREAQHGAEEVAEAVASIVREVGTRGDEAVRELTRRLDGVEVEPSARRVDPDRIEAAVQALAPAMRDAMELAAANIRALAEAETAAGPPVEVELADGQVIRLVATPVHAAGVYAPGGLAAYPSSVLMCCVPAQVAGVSRIAVASPPGPDGSVPPAVLAACAVAGVSEVHAVGGAQAVAALALGTDTIAPVDLVVGPGNRYVVEAKRLLSARVGTDAIAGPTELVVVADGSADPEWIALDLCAQAEHGSCGPLVAISPDAGVLDRVAALLPVLASGRPSVADVPVSLVRAPEVDAALALSDALAPEHLELQLEAGGEELAGSRVAGCVFVGASAGAAFGDYAAGSNHVLPTGGAARFAGPLGAGTFLRRTSIVSIPERSAAALAPHVGTLARAEGFPVHGESAEARAGDNRRET